MSGQLLVLRCACLALSRVAVQKAGLDWHHGMGALPILPCCRGSHSGSLLLAPPLVPAAAAARTRCVLSAPPPPASAPSASTAATSVFPVDIWQDSKGVCRSVSAQHRQAAASTLRIRCPSLPSGSRTMATCLARSPAGLPGHNPCPPACSRGSSFALPSARAQRCAPSGPPACPHASICCLLALLARMAGLNCSLACVPHCVQCSVTGGPSCKVCNHSTGKCRQCWDNFGLSGVKCKTCKDSHCFQCNGDTAICKQCFNGFRLIKGACLEVATYYGQLVPCQPEPRAWHRDPLNSFITPPRAPRAFAVDVHISAPTHPTHCPSVCYIVLIYVLQLPCYRPHHNVGSTVHH